MINERLIFIRESLDMSQRVLAEELNISKSTLARWETGESIIPLEHLVDLCNLSKRSLDYAFGLSNNRTNIDKPIKNNRSKLSKKLKQLRVINNNSQSEIADYLHTSQSTVSQYENNVNLIQTAFLYQLCVRYNYSADELLS